jgi:hypothetical protein
VTLGPDPDRNVERQLGEWKSSIRPDDGEGLVKRKGVAARQGLKEAWSKAADGQEPDREAYSAGRASN